MRKILYGITLILSIAMCLSLLIFPILKFDREAISNNHQDEINEYIAAYRAAQEKDPLLEPLSDEELKEDKINEIIYVICTSLQIYYNTPITDIEVDEEGIIRVSSDGSAIVFDIERMKEKGIKYTDLVNSIKNQIEYNSLLSKAIKKQYGKSNNKVFFANWSNPIPMIVLVILIALEFAGAVLIIIRSIKGILGIGKIKIVRMAVFGLVISIGLLLMPLIFKQHIVISEITKLSEYVNLFAMNVKGSGLCYYYLVAFILCGGLAFIAKFFKE